MNKNTNLFMNWYFFLFGVPPHRYQAKKNGLPQNNKNDHNAQNFRFGVFQNLSLMGMGYCRHFTDFIS